MTVESFTPDECANCGAAIPRGARACPGCGADERTGWREVSVDDDLGLPDEEDRNLLPGADDPHRRRVNGLKWYWYAIAALLLAMWASTELWLGQ